MADSDFLAIGAEAIARDVFANALTVKQVYRLAEGGGWPFFKVGNKLAMRLATARAEIARREEASRAAPAPEPRKRHQRQEPGARRSP